MGTSRAVVGLAATVFLLRALFVLAHSRLKPAVVLAPRLSSTDGNIFCACFISSYAAGRFVIGPPVGPSLHHLVGISLLLAGELRQIWRLRRA